MIPRISVYYLSCDAIVPDFKCSEILSKLLEILKNRKDLKSHTRFFGVVDPPVSVVLLVITVHNTL